MSLAKKINLREDETIEQVLSQHYFCALSKYIFAGILLLGSAFFSFWLLHRGWWGELFLGLGLVIGFSTLIRTWFFHQANVLIITNLRVVRVLRRGWFDELVTSLYVDDIYDTTMRRAGILGRFFNYGTLVLRAADGGAALSMPFLSDPQGVEQTILDLREAASHLAERTDQEGIYSSFLSLVPELSVSELKIAREKIDRQLSRSAVVGLKS